MQMSIYYARNSNKWYSLSKETGNRGILNASHFRCPAQIVFYKHLRSILIKVPAQRIQIFDADKLLNVDYLL